MRFRRRKERFQVWAVTDVPFHDEFPVTEPLPHNEAERARKLSVYPGVVYELRPEGYELREPLSERTHRTASGRQ